MERRAGRPLRWWQRLVVIAALEHDEFGSLVWPLVLVSTTRQVGKSTTLRELMLWRMTEGSALLGNEAETMLHVAGILDQAREVWSPAALWAERQPNWKVRRSNGENELTHEPSGSRWLLRAAGSGGFAFTVSMGCVDEAWRVQPHVVEDGIAPALIEPQSSQLWLVSTAHPAATELVPANRAQLLAELASDDPHEGLLLEWSAQPGRRSEDVFGWREASPIWTERREAFVRSRLDKSTDEASFRCQWLNVWPSVSRRKLANVETWQAALDVPSSTPHGSVWGALEVSRDGGLYGACLAWRDAAGTVHLRSRSGPRLLPLTNWLLPQLTATGGQALVSVGLRGQVNAQALGVTAHDVGMAELAGAVANTQALLAEGRLRHDGDPALARQVDSAAIVETDRGPHLSAARSAGTVEVVRAMLWTIQAATGEAFAAPVIR
jgi:phage terminase large subunit-like protein